MIPDLSVPRLYRCLSLLVLGLSAACGIRESAEDPEDPPVPTYFLKISFEEALALSRERGLPVFITVQSPLRDRSGPALDREYWADPALAELLQERTIPLRIIADESPDFVAEHKVWFFPTILLFNAEGEIETRIQGMPGVEVISLQLHRLLNAPHAKSQVQTK